MTRASSAAPVETTARRSSRPGAAARIAMFLIRAYQVLAPPLVRGHCRFAPSCSEYAHQSVKRHGLARGLAFAARRIARCHPLSASGYDPVP